AMIGAAVVLPLYMQDMLGFSPVQSGLALLPGAIMVGVLNPITGTLFDKFGARWLAITGLAILTITTLMLSILTTETSFAYIATVNALRSLGIAMTLMP